MQSKKRLYKELNELDKLDEELTFQAYPINDIDLYHWQATIFGPKDTPYEGGIFFLNIDFPYDYPLNLLKSDLLLEFFILIYMEMEKYVLIHFNI